MDISMIKFTVLWLIVKNTGLDRINKKYKFKVHGLTVLFSVLKCYEEMQGSEHERLRTMAFLTFTKGKHQA